MAQTLSGIFIKRSFNMNWSFKFFFTSIMLGAGLAMDATAVSMANGLNEPKMSKGKMLGIAGMFSFFQALMPLIGWICVHTVVQCFETFERFIPWIALILLCYIGGKMLYDGIKNKEEDGLEHSVGFKALVVQGIATSIDALSVGFTIADYGFVQALVAALLISAVTFILCTSGVMIGKKFGTWLANKATILGGCILIAIGLEIFITGIM